MTSTAPPPSTPPSPTPPPPPVWPPANSSVVARHLSKSFGALTAVSDISFAIQPGVTALLGPNGAGKSTLIRLICGLTAPTAGSIEVAGGNPRIDAVARGRIGLVPQQDGVFEREQALDVVALAAVLSGMDNPTKRAREALEIVELDPDIARPLGTFSKGMRQRVKIAQAIIHEPTVLMLDEPLNGLDPRQRRQMTELFAQLGTGNRTVLVSSHVLEEVERFGSDVLVIAHGRMAAQGDFRAIRDLMDDQPMQIRVKCERAREVAGRLVSGGVVKGIEITGDAELEVITTDARRFRLEIGSICQKLNSRITEIKPLDDDLESVFRYLVGKGP